MIILFQQQQQLQNECFRVPPVVFGHFHFIFSFFFLRSGTTTNAYYTTNTNIHTRLNCSTLDPHFANYSVSHLCNCNTLYNTQYSTCMYVCIYILMCAIMYHHGPCATHQNLVIFRTFGPLLWANGERERDRESCTAANVRTARSTEKAASKRKRKDFIYFKGFLFYSNVMVSSNIHVFCRASIICILFRYAYTIHVAIADCANGPGTVSAFSLVIFYFYIFFVSLRKQIKNK